MFTSVGLVSLFNGLVSAWSDMVHHLCSIYCGLTALPISGQPPEVQAVVIPCGTSVALGWKESMSSTLSRGWI